MVHLLEGSKALPAARRMTLPHLLTGAEDGQWVEMEGVVRSVESYGQHVVLTLATTDGSLTATAVKEDGSDYAGLVDAKVLIRGVAAPLVDNKGQMTGVRLLFPGLRSIQVEQPGPTNPFDLPALPLNTLLQYSPTLGLEHRVHIQGKLTLFWPGRMLCLQEGKDGLCVDTKDGGDLAPGEEVDVVGFPALENFEPTLAESVLKRARSGVPMHAGAITAEEAFVGGHQAELVQIEGRLVGRSRVMTDPALLMSSGKSVFLVVLPPSSALGGKDKWPSLIDGSSLRITGVFSGKVDTRQTTRREGISQIESFQILVRSREDVVLVAAPSWWSAQHSLIVLSFVGIMTLAVLAWVIMLRRRVEQQTLLIRRSEGRFRHQAEHDSLTGLTSRSSLHEHFALALKEAKRDGTALAVLMMDVDNFKQVNDSLGHAAGDEVLCTVARRLRASVRKCDTLARMGGDEFLGLLSGVKDIRELGRIAAEVVACVSAPIHVDGREVPISISVGISTLSRRGRECCFSPPQRRHGHVPCQDAGSQLLSISPFRERLPSTTATGESHTHDPEVLTENRRHPNCL